MVWGPWLHKATVRYFEFMAKAAEEYRRQAWNDFTWSDDRPVPKAKSNDPAQRPKAVEPDHKPLE